MIFLYIGTSPPSWWSHIALPQEIYEHLKKKFKITISYSRNPPLRNIYPSNARWLSQGTPLVRIHEQYLQLTTRFSLVKEKERCSTARMLHAMHQDEKTGFSLCSCWLNFKGSTCCSSTHTLTNFAFLKSCRVWCSLLRRILHSSAVSTRINMDFEINYLPPD